MAHTIEELAYDLSLAAVAQQESRAHELRTRTGTLLAAAAVTASFFGARSVAAGDLDTPGAFALVAFLCSVGAGLVVLLPHRLVLEFRGTALLGTARRSGLSLTEAYEGAATWIEEFHETNRSTLEALSRWYTASLVAVGIEIALWSVSVSGILP